MVTQKRRKFTGMSKHKEKVFAWAEQRLDLPTGTVTNVDFGTDEDGQFCCSGWASSGVYVTHSVPLTGRQKKPRFEDSFICLDGQPLSNVIEEILGPCSMHGVLRCSFC